jgi:hypothetical protein
LLAGVFAKQKIERMRERESQSKTDIIAIVDDDAPLREALGSVMKAAGFLTDAFASAEAYLDSTKRQETMCLILDVRLPGMTVARYSQPSADHIRHRPWRCSAPRFGDEGWSRRFPEQARTERHVAERNSRSAQVRLAGSVRADVIFGERLLNF